MKDPVGRGLFLWISVFLSFVIALILWVVSLRLIDNQEAQQMAQRWSPGGGSAQISCFFSTNTGITPDRIKEIEHNLDSKLQEASIVSESQNPGARMWADAYSAYGKITVKSHLGNITADAIGIGAPVFNADGVVSASIGIIAPKLRIINDEHLHNLQEHVKRYAAELSCDLGYMPRMNVM